MQADAASEQTVQKKKAFMDHVMEALRSPSYDHMLDHMLIYTFIVVFITFVAIVVSMTCWKSVPKEKAFDKDALCKDLFHAGPFLQTTTGEILPDAYAKLK